MDTIKVGGREGFIGNGKSKLGNRFLANEKGERIRTGGDICYGIKYPKLDVRQCLC